MESFSPQVAGVNLKEIGVFGSGVRADLSISNGTLSHLGGTYDITKIEVVSSLWVGGDIELKLKVYGDPDPQAQIGWEDLRIQRDDKDPQENPKSYEAKEELSFQAAQANQKGFHIPPSGIGRSLMTYGYGEVSSPKEYGWDFFNCKGQTPKEILKDCLITLIEHDFFIDSSSFAMSRSFFLDLSKSMDIINEPRYYYGINLESNSFFPLDRIVFVNSKQQIAGFTIINEN